MESLVLDSTVPAQMPVLQPVVATPFDHHEMARYAIEAYKDGKVVLKELNDPAWQRFFAYTERESYLAWVAAWKANYRELTLRQRTIKAELRAAGSNLPWDLPARSSKTATTHSYFWVCGQRPKSIPGPSVKPRRRRLKDLGFI